MVGDADEALFASCMKPFGARLKCKESSGCVTMQVLWHTGLTLKMILSLLYCEDDPGRDHGYVLM